MGRRKSTPSVAVLIHHASQWAAALSAANALTQTGAAVTVFCIGQAPNTLAAPEPRRAGVECYADTCQPGMASMPLEEMAHKLKHFDLVIPF